MKALHGNTVAEWQCLAAEEQFEAGGEELRRHFSMDGGFEPEKLRAAPSAEAQRQVPDPLFTGDSGLGDDIMSTGRLSSARLVSILHKGQVSCVDKANMHPS